MTFTRLMLQARAFLFFYFCEFAFGARTARPISSCAGQSGHVALCGRVAAATCHDMWPVAPSWLGFKFKCGKRERKTSILPQCKVEALAWWG